MGRRAARQPDPSLDLGGHLLAWDDLPRPCDCAALFGRQGPLEVEVGSGKGLFLLNASAARPDHCFLGVELADKYARLAAARLAKAGRHNAKVLSGDGLALFREALGANTARAAHVYFPDPWWKKRHRKRRVMNEAFVRDAERVLEPGGRLHFWTDVEEYFTATLALLAEATRLQGPLFPGESPAAHDLDYRTHFERRMRAQGHDVFRAEYVKPLGDAATSASAATGDAQKPSERSASGEIA